MEQEIIVKIEEDDWCYQPNESSTQIGKPPFGESEMTAEINNINSLIKFEDNQICGSLNESLNLCDISNTCEEKHEIDSTVPSNEECEGRMNPDSKTVEKNIGIDKENFDEEEIGRSDETFSSSLTSKRYNY